MPNILILLTLCTTGCWLLPQISPWSVHALSGLARGQAIFLEAMATGLWAAAITLSLRVHHRCRQRPSGALTVLLISSSALPAWLLLMFYVLSWGLFAMGHIFIGYEALRMLHQDPKQLLEHLALMDLPLLLKTTSLAGLLCGAAWWLSKPRCAERLQRPSRYYFSIGLLITVLWSVALFVYLPHPPASAINTTAQPQRQAMGPLSAFFLDIWQTEQLKKQLSLANVLDATKQTQQLLGPAVITLDTYINRIPPSTITAPKPNVIVLLIESLRKDVFPRYHMGQTAVVMPNLDRLAEQSRVFTHAYSESSHSNYADIGPFSSRYPLYNSRTYYYPKKIPFPYVMLYDLLKTLGYATAIISSQNEHWGGMLNILNTPGLDTLRHADNFNGELRKRIHLKTPDYVRRMMGPGKAYGKVDDAATISRVIDWLDTLPQQKPAFLYINLQNSHYPYRLPKTFPRRFATSNTEIDHELEFNLTKASNWPIYKRRYFDTLAYIDVQIGRLLTALRRTHRLANTVLIVSGDTGTAFGELGRMGNAGQLEESVVNVPLFIHAPHLSPGFDTRPAQHIDIAPTVLSLLKLPPHPSFQGLDLTSANRHAHRPIFLVAQSPVKHQYAVIQDQKKCVYTPKTHQLAYYDLQQDPGTLHNLTKQRPNEAKVAFKALRNWIRQQIQYYQKQPQTWRHYPGKPDLARPSAPQKTNAC